MPNSFSCAFFVEHLEFADLGIEERGVGFIFAGKKDELPDAEVCRRSQDCVDEVSGQCLKECLEDRPQLIVLPWIDVSSVFQDQAERCIILYSFAQVW